MWFIWILVGLCIGAAVMGTVAGSQYEKGYEDGLNRVPETDIEVDPF